MRTRLLVFIVAGFLIGALTAAAVLLLTAPEERGKCNHLGRRWSAAPSRSIGADGKTVTDQDFRGRYMLVFFGFTHCPDICPAELQVIAEALDKLGDKAAKVVPIFITVDPERDSPRPWAST